MFMLQIDGLKLLTEKMQSCVGDYERVLASVNNVLDATSSSLDQLQRTSGCTPDSLKAQISGLKVNAVNLKA